MRSSAPLRTRPFRHAGLHPASILFFSLVREEIGGPRIKSGVTKSCCDTLPLDSHAAQHRMRRIQFRESEMSDESGLRAEVETLSARVGRLEDVNAIRRLHYAYGYYIDMCMYDEVIDLFAEDSEVIFLSGVYRGKAGAARGSTRPGSRNSSPAAGPARSTASCSTISRCRTSSPSPTTAEARRADSGPCSPAAITSRGPTSPRACRCNSGRPAFTRMIMSARTASGRSGDSIIASSGRPITRPAGRGRKRISARRA